MEGVSSVVANAESKTATITFGPPATEEMIISLLKSIDYPIAV